MIRYIYCLQTPDKIHFGVICLLKDVQPHQYFLDKYPSMLRQDLFIDGGSDWEWVL